MIALCLETRVLESSGNVNRICRIIETTDITSENFVSYCF